MIRLGYVMITRARETLVICAPAGANHMPLASFAARAPDGAGRTSAAAPAIWGHAAEDRRLAAADGVDAGDGLSEIRRPGAEGRRDVRAMQLKDRISRVWQSAAWRRLRLAGARTAPKQKNCNSEARRKAAGCMLSMLRRNREPK